MKIINQSFDKLRIDPEQGQMGQNFERSKNGLVYLVREREREDAFTCPFSKQIRDPTLAVFPPEAPARGWSASGRDLLLADNLYLEWTKPS